MNDSIESLLNDVGIDDILKYTVSESFTNSIIIASIILPIVEEVFKLAIDDKVSENMRKFEISQKLHELYEKAISNEALQQSERVEQIPVGYQEMILRIKNHFNQIKINQSM